MPPTQKKMDGFLARLSPEEWANEQEQRRLDAIAEAQASPSVQEIPQPSVQFVPAKRGPGRPRKPRQLIVDLTHLTTNDLVIASQGTDGTGGTGANGTNGTGGTDGTGKSSGTDAKLKTPSASPPSVVKGRRDWMHPSLFLRIYRYVQSILVSKTMATNLFFQQDCSFKMQLQGCSGLPQAS